MDVVTYSIGDLWLVGITAAAGAVVMTWLVMTILASRPRDEENDIWRNAWRKEETRANKAEKTLAKHSRAARLAQEHLEDINGPKVEHSITYTS